MPVVVRRAGSPEPALDVLSDLVGTQRLALFRKCQVTMPIVDLASTDIRQRVACAQSIRYRTPRAVEKYIETHGLYLDC